jgi:hypothetical protein
MMKVGLSSCSRSSIIPTLPSSDIAVCLVLEPGLLGVLPLSKDWKVPVEAGRGGLEALLRLPLAIFKVVTPPVDSSRTLFNMAAASELLNLPKSGRSLVEVCEKNKGDVGAPTLEVKALGKVLGSNICRGLGFLDGRSEETGRECFEAGTVSRGRSGLRRERGMPSAARVRPSSANLVVFGGAGLIAGALEPAIA